MTINHKRNVLTPPSEFSLTESDRVTTYIGEKAGVFYAIRSKAKPTKLPDFGAEPMRYRPALIWIRFNNGKDGFAKPAPG